MRLIFRIVQIVFAGILALLLVAVITVCVWCFVPFGVLPSQYAMVQIDPSELETVVLKITPIGTDRVDVEQALRRTFCRTWEVKKNDSVGSMSNHNFHVLISDGDYYLISTFAAFGIMPKIATIKFLFDGEDKLKDVLAIIWDETI